MQQFNSLLIKKQHHSMTLHLL